MPVKRKRAPAAVVAADKVIGDLEKELDLTKSRLRVVEGDIAETEQERDDLAEALKGTQAKLIDAENAYKIARAKIDRLKSMVSEQQIAIAEANGYIRRVGDQDIAREGVTIKTHSEPVPHAPPVPMFYAGGTNYGGGGPAGSLADRMVNREHRWSDDPWSMW